MHQKVKNLNSRYGAVAKVMIILMVVAIAVVVGLTVAFGITSLVIQLGPWGMSAIETIYEAAKEVAEDVVPGLENVTKVVQENGALVGTEVMGQNKG